MTRYAIALACATLLAAPARGDVVGTKHDLSLSGSGPIKAFGEDEVCVFCHAPHNTSPETPLWNRSLPSLSYTLYSSSTLQAQPGQPTGSSKLCLSCHDGTIALGAVLSRDVPISVSGSLADRSVLTTDLSDDHPVSFVYDFALVGEDPELALPDQLTGAVRLDDTGQMQCSSCHDAHSDAHPDFLVSDPSYGALCLACHEKVGWAISAHAASSATWNGSGVDPWPHSELDSVAANACDNCHTSHAAGSPEGLLRFPFEEDNCLHCHDASVAEKDIAAELSKPYGHPVDSYFAVHEPAEDFLSMPRHVECQDCHDPHQVTAGTASPPAVGGPLEGAAGVTLGGVATDPASDQYEVCLRCHGDNPNLPTPVIERQVFQPNLRLEIATFNPSFHPIAGPGQNPDVPSLIPPLTETSIIYCTDCHANDSGPGAGGTGPAGPHGSNWPFLLEREYRIGDRTPESFQAYSLCYKCHDRNNILANRSFKEHSRHIRGKNAPCSVCHDPHGISSSQGDSTDHSHLINFDTTIVIPDPTTGLLRFEDLGANRGRCYLQCHGKKHSPKEY